LAILNRFRIANIGLRHEPRRVRFFARSQALTTLEKVLAQRNGVVPIVIAAFVAFEVFNAGLPGLWHDWRIPAEAGSLGPWIATFFEGWVPGGIGSIQAYPTFYLIGFLLWPLHSLLSSYAVMLAIVCLTVLLASIAAMQLARNLGADALAEIALALFACLNPWVYSKYVAGHTLMIFTYAVMLGLLAEVTRSKPRMWRLVLLAAFTISQIEFFLIAAPLVCIWALRRRAWTVALAVAFAAAPIFVGLAASYGEVRSTPFNLSWQRAQSVDLRQAVVLQGYVFDYARAFWPLEPFSIAIAIAALFGIRRVLDDRRCTVAVAVSASALMFASGTKGPFGLPYTWLVLHVPEIGVYRELYDLVGVVAIGYMVLLATGIGAWRPGAALLLAATCSYAFPWITRPPATFFVDVTHLPRPEFPAIPDARVALEPAFQPITAGGRGSGVDPDAYGRAGFASPINEVFPAFPVDSALGFMTFRHDDRYLKALSVAKVIPRPYLQTNFKTLRFQWIAMNGQIGAARYRALDGLSMLTILASDPGLATIANRPDEAAIFFGDAVSEKLGRFTPDPSLNDASLGWADARLAVPMHPEWGTAFGGVATQSAAPLPLSLPADGTSLLAQTNRQIVDERGRIIAHRSSALHWWPLAAGVRAIRCFGTCIVVLQAKIPARLPEHRPMGAARAVHVDFITPWLGVATLPAGTKGTLRLNVRYAVGWQAFVAGRPLPHLRLDTALNAWKFAKVPVGGGTTVTFVESIAALQLALEVLVAAAIAALATFEGLRAYRSA